jgi:DNA-binding MarR family transcriptional regulator/GNAT superfamily N-acetyltransferase
MSTEQVAALRSFNRTVTERIGALSDQHLSRARPLGASRVLGEVGLEGSDARSLRAKLGLDSGYLSRLLRRLEAEDLIEVAPDVADSRVRVIRLTPAGLAERRLLDRGRDELAASLLAPLDPGQRARLVAAAVTVERLLTASMVTIGIEDPASEAARFCIGQYFRELDARFDEARSISAGVDELTEPADLLLVARLRSEPVGCGALKLRGAAPAEIKRMWVSAEARGLGLGRRILTELEQQAADRGVAVLRLETNRALVEAIGLYRSADYREVRPFNDEPSAHHWFEKRIDR